jgi:hypothetical protein
LSNPTQDTAAALSMGLAAAALKRTIPDDLPLVCVEEIKQASEHSGEQVKRWSVGLRQ